MDVANAVVVVVVVVVFVVAVFFFRCVLLCVASGCGS